MRELVPGATVAGYRIEALIGRGGMGVVYAARQVGLDRAVALKVIAPELLDDGDVRDRFLAEARAAASVDHANVIPVYDAGEADGVAYIAMRYVAGDDLRSLVRFGGPLAPVEAAAIIAQAASALDAIHRAGFVHRDVKPANLLVDADRHVYLTDFGLAKSVLTRTGGTRTGQWVGTLDYVAPEQIRGGRIDARVDIYALGGALYYALTGRVPFEREGDEAKLWAQLAAPPPAPSALQAGVHREFDAVVARAMAKTPDDRYLSAGDVGRAASAAVRGQRPSEPERMVARGAAKPGAAASEPGLAPEDPTRTSRPAPRTRRRRRAVLVGGVVAVGAVAGALLTLDEERPAPGAAVVSPAPTSSPEATPTAVARVAKTIDGIGDRPAGIALAHGDLWITSPRQPFLTRVDAATGRERAHHPKIGRDAAAIVAYRGAVWVAMGEQRKVLRLDPRTGDVRATIAVDAEPRRLTVAASGVWVGDPEGALLRYDLDTGRLLQRFHVREGVGGVLAADGVIWVVKLSTNRVARLEPGAQQLVDWATLPARPETMRYGRAALWITLEGEDAISRVDVDGRRLVTAAVGRGPAQAVAAGGHVFVSSRNDQTVVVLDPEELQPVGEPIRVGFNPTAMVADGRSLWVISTGANTLTRIDRR